MTTLVETMAFLHTHGLEREPKALDADLKAAIKMLQCLYFAEAGQEGLTASEMAVALTGGLDPCPKAGEQTDPLLAGVVALASLIHTGLTTAQAAEKLGVSDARIRQRLHDQTLVAIRDGRGWKLPLFQFAGKQELPGWGEVARHLPGQVSPVAVAQWLLLPHPDLTSGEDETPMSPRAWLLEGRSAKVVAALVRELA